MIDIFSYKKDKIGKDTFRELGRAPAWIRCVNPDVDTIKLLSEKFKIPIEELKETIEEEERPKILIDKYIEIIYRAPYLEEDGDIITKPIYIYLFRDKVMTIEKEELDIFSKLSEQMISQKAKFIFKKGLPYFIYNALDKINDTFLLKIDKISDKIDFYEEKTKKTLTQKDIEKLYEQSVTLSIFNQALIANLEVLNALRKSYFKLFTQRDKYLYGELYYNALQILDTEKIQREVIANLFNLQAVIAGDKLNQFIKKLTTLALVVAIPTMISGIYGMNFKHIPLADNPYGFHITSLFIAGLTIVLWIYFRKGDWL